MKRWMMALVLALGLLSVASADEPGTYKQVCRSDDPFVYCTQGCKETKAWKPAQPYASIAYRPQPGYCPLPMTGQCCFGNVCFKAWSQRDYNDYMQNRVTVCPRAHDDGDWVRENGQGAPEDEPVSH